jgi:hypothetical protein
MPRAEPRARTPGVFSFAGHSLAQFRHGGARSGRSTVGGQCGTISGHRFDALVFPEHAECDEYELGKSRISKLWLQRLEDKKTVFNWDRGLDVDATTDLARAIVDFLAAGLADLIYAN